MELIFYNSTHHLKSLLNENENEIPASSLKILGQPLIIRNINIVSKVVNIDVIKIPKELPNVLELVQNSFPSICIQEYDNSQYQDDDHYHHSINNKEKISSIKIPINSLVYYKVYKNKDKDKSDNNDTNSGNNTSISSNSVSNSNGNNDNSSSNRIVTDSIIYPWDFLNAIEKVLNKE